MSRPAKKSMDYFPHDTDAATDEKLEAIESVYGNDGYAFTFKAYERIYRTDSAELDISRQHIRAALMARTKVAPDRFEQILALALEIDLFSLEEYESRGVLTSSGIKKRHAQIQSMRDKWRKKKVKTEPESFPLGKPEKEKGGRNAIKESKVNNILSCKISEIISTFNTICGTSFSPATKTTAQAISARLEDGYTAEDFAVVIAHKARQWRGTDQEQYLRPSTLFRPSHFESYLQDARRQKNGAPEQSKATDLSKLKQLSLVSDRLLAMTEARKEQEMANV
jgi:uncharacterized phage protein (TIGR02220 family)